MKMSMTIPIAIGFTLVLSAVISAVPISQKAYAQGSPGAGSNGGCGAGSSCTQAGSTGTGGAGSGGITANSGSTGTGGSGSGFSDTLNVGSTGTGGNGSGRTTANYGSHGHGGDSIGVGGAP
jgi:hypothetical protein